MESLDNKCPTCGAKLDFNSEKQKWCCEYCNSEFNLEDLKKFNNASSDKVNVSNKIEGNENFNLYHCKNCGAEIVADDATIATFCVYCGSTAILKEKINYDKIPNYIIPFKNKKEDAISAFKNLLKKKPLAPKCFKSENNIKKITGIYIPFWAYDLEAFGTVDFIGEDTKNWDDDNYYYTKTDTYAVKKSGSFQYNKVLADASSKFPDDLMDSLEPFDYSQLVEYNHAYLAGFFADKYDISEDDGMERASSRTNNTSVELLKNSVDHDFVSVKNNQLSVSKKHTYYILLPVWLLNIKYKDKDYIFAMNGQTGKIIGNIPIGVTETIIIALTIFIVIFILVYLGLKYL